jgi:hypothetical protein
MKLHNIIFPYDEQNKKLKMALFWDVAPCSLVDIDRRFRVPYYLNRYCDEWLITLKRRSVPTKLHFATSQKTDIFIAVGVRYCLLTELPFVAGVEEHIIYK